MKAKLVKLPEAMIQQIERRAKRWTKLTGERFNFSQALRELVRLGLDAQKKGT